MPTAMAAAMTSPPLLARRWDEGFSTLYTAAYRPVSETLTYIWPGVSRPLALGEPLPDSFEVDLDDDR